MTPQELFKRMDDLNVRMCDEWRNRIKRYKTINEMWESIGGIFKLDILDFIQDRLLFEAFPDKICPKLIFYIEDMLEIAENIQEDCMRDGDDYTVYRTKYRQWGKEIYNYVCYLTVPNLEELIEYVLYSIEEQRRIHG